MEGYQPQLSVPIKVDAYQNTSSTPNYLAPWELPQRQLLVGIGALTATLLAVPAPCLAYGSLALGLVFVLIYVVITTLEGKGEPFLLAWLLISPLGYYYLSYPRDKALWTFDRTVIPLLVVAMCFRSPSDHTAVPRPLRRAGFAWGVFLLAAGLSLVKISGSTNVFSGVRVLLDAFLLPAVVGLYVVRCFPVRRHLRTIRLLVCLTTLYLVPIGLIEFFSGQDLLPLPSAGLYFGGSGDTLFLRANGPYSSSNSYSLIGLVIFSLLSFLRRALAVEGMPWWQRVMHWVATLSALVISLLSLHRSILITLVLIFLLQIWFAHTVRRRFVDVSILSVLLGVFFLAAGALPNLFEERVWSGENVSARMAQQRQTFEVFEREPILGVGLNNFISSAPQGTPYTGAYSGVDPLDAPHSNLGAILAETGVVGFIPYVLANALLVVAFWQLRKFHNWVWKIFLFVFLSYWVTGLSVTSGHYGDLNLWYVLTLAVLYKYTITAEDEKLAAPV